MSLHDAFVWLGHTPVGRFFAASTAAFAAIESLHVVAIGVLGGAFIAVDLTGLRVIFRKADPLGIARSLLPMFLTALALAAISGVLIVSAGPMKYYTNPLFPVKLGTLAVALVIHLAIYPGLALVRDRGGAAFVRPLTGVLGLTSIVLWTSVAILGRWLGLI